MENKSTVTYRITRSFGAIRQTDRGWTRELNMVSWNDMPEKFDIRDWNDDHSKCGRGITLTVEEMETLLELAQNGLEKVKADE
ncbi:MAG: PC4/YdbC family ssDNA-binding protein [Clostridiales bacterium]|nr:PC4/YdbC family ssDNA-binding protein [Clostridiales bacterium]MDD7347192.1 PC4/YdbC family ssDNA-binding protein [Clostridiales bacterium]MDY4060972.1 PC4/YdbC family ssDNA-binding protein [Anaerovoracaceae bacterium]